MVQKEITMRRKPSKTRLAPASVSSSWAALVAVALAAATAVAGEPGAGSCAFLIQGDATVANDGRVDGDLLATPTRGRVHLGRRVRMGDGTTLSAATVEVGNDSSVFDVRGGKVKLGKRVHVRGQQSSAPLALADTVCQRPAATCGGQDVKVSKQGTHPPLTPGSYGKLELMNDAKLDLVAGSFQFCSIRAGRRVRLRVTGGGAASVDVTGDVRLGNGSTFGGDQVTPTLRAGGKLTFGADTKVTADLVAPRGLLTLGRQATFTGTFCADRLSTGQRVRLTCAGAPTTTTVTTSTTTTTKTTVTATTTTTSTTVVTSTTLAAQLVRFSAHVSARASANLPSGPSDSQSQEMSAAFDPGESMFDTSLTKSVMATASESETGCDVSGQMQASIDTALVLHPGDNAFLGLTYTGSFSGSAHRNFVTNCESDARPDATSSVQFVIPGGTRPYTLTATLAATGALSDTVRVQLFRSSPTFANIELVVPPANGETHMGVLTAGTYTLSAAMGSDVQILPNPPGNATLSGTASGMVTFTLD